MIKLIQRELYNCKYQLIFIIICALLQILLPILTGNLLDILIYLNDLKRVYSLIILFMLLSLAKVLLNYLKNILIIKCESNTSNRLLIEILDIILRKEYISINIYTSVYLTQRVTNDIKVFLKFVIGTVSTMLVAIISCLLAFFVLLRANIIFAIISLSSIPIYFFLYMLLNKKIYLVNYKYKENQDIYVSHINEQIKLFEEVKINNLYSYVTNTIEKKYRLLYDSILKSYKINYILNSLDGILNLGIQSLFFIIGAFLIQDDKLSIGTFTVIITFYSMIISNIQYFYGLSKQWQESKVSLFRLEELINIKEEKSGEFILNRVNSIEINNILFSYTPNLNISYPNMRLIKGNVYIISGKNGAGKSTLFHILIGLLSIKDGAIVLNEDLNLNSIDINYFRENNISYVMQEPKFWDLSVGENVSIFLHRGISLEEFYKMIEKEKLEDFVGYEFLESSLWNKSVNELSVGQKKKLMICIQLVKNYDIILLDEPNASLDEKSINSLHDWIDKKKKEKIILIITHDNSFDNYKENIINID